MKKYLRALTAIVLIIFTLTAALSACSYNDGEPISYGNGGYVVPDVDYVGEESDNGESSNTQDTEEIIDVDVSIFANGKTDFDIVISNLASEVISSAANDIKAAFSSKLGASIDISNEYHFKLFNGFFLGIFVQICLRRCHFVFICAINSA